MPAQLTNYSSLHSCISRPWESLRSWVKEGPMVGFREPRMSSTAFTPMSGVVCGVNDQDNEEVGMGVGVPQSFVFSPLLFILVLGALSREFCTGVPWELLYAVDLGLIVDIRSVSPSSRRGRLAWKVRGSASTWRRPSSWFLVMAKMSSRNLASIPVLSAAVVSAATPSCAHSACCRSTRSAVAPRSD